MFILFIDLLFPSRAHGADPREDAERRRLREELEAKLRANGQTPVTEQEQQSQVLGGPRDGYNSFDPWRTGAESWVAAGSIIRLGTTATNFTTVYQGINTARQGMQLVKIAENAGYIARGCAYLRNAGILAKIGAFRLAAPVARLFGFAQPFLRSAGTLLSKLPLLGRCGRFLAIGGGRLIPAAGAIMAAVDCGNDIFRAIRTGDDRDIGNAAINTGCTAAGAIIGGVIGSIIPGAGTVLGAMIGAGIGNLVGNIAKAIMPEGVTRAIGGAVKAVGSFVGSVARKLNPFSWFS